MKIYRIIGLINKFIHLKIAGINFLAPEHPTSIHKTAIIEGATIFGNVLVGENAKIRSGVALKTASKIIVGRFTSINGPNTDVLSHLKIIKIGNFCSIARNVSIQEFNHNYKVLSTYSIRQTLFKETKAADLESKGDIEIGNDVWIGTHCVILSGAKIGDGAIIAANSVVSGEIPPFAIVGGSPAKVIKYRFSKELIEEIQKIKWWNWPVEKIMRNKELFVGELTMEKLSEIKE